jgi:hypothetical protein
MNQGTKCLLWIILGLIAGCTRYNPNIRFDKKGWSQKEDWNYPQRENMVNDLIKHHQLKGLSYKQLTDPLGEPENFPDTSGIHYQLLMDFGDDIDPVHTKYLVFKLTKDSVVSGYRIKEWKKDN